MDSVLQIVIAISVLILTVFLSILLYETAKTVASLRDVLILVKNELEPALKSVNGVLTTVSDVTTTAHKNLGMLKNIAATAIGATVLAVSKAVSKDSGFFKGFKSGLSKFKKGDKKCL